MESLKGLRAQEQPSNIEPSVVPARAGTVRSHEAAETHRRDLGSDAVVAGVIQDLDPDGEGALVGLRPGDRVLAVEGQPIQDVLEFHFLTSGEPATLRVRRGAVDLEVRLPGQGPSGIHFEKELFDGLRRCENSCVFCFVHQLPRRGLRKSLLMKDEDYRLSFLHGGYMTLGNLKEPDWERILGMRLSPMYVSVHATDPEVRRRMLGNARTPDVREGLARLRDGGIDVHGQIVLVPGYNDGPILERTLRDLAAFPNLRGCAVVPVGLTRFREHLPDIRGLTREEARRAVRTVDAARARDAGSPRFFAADELHQQAGLPQPPAEYFGEGYPLREDGVGMLRSFEDRFLELATRPWPEPAAPRRRSRRGRPRPVRVAVVTGTAAAPHMRRWLEPRGARVPDLELDVLEVVNRFFGEGITVAGLLTAPDIVDAVRAAGSYDRVLVGEHAFQPGGDLMLDGATLADLRGELGTEVLKVADDPGALIEAILGVPCGFSRAGGCGSAVNEPGLFGDGEPDALEHPLQPSGEPDALQWAGGAV